MIGFLFSISKVFTAICYYININNFNKIDLYKN